MAEPVTADDTVGHRRGRDDRPFGPVAYEDHQERQVPWEGGGIIAEIPTVYPPGVTPPVVAPPPPARPPPLTPPANPPLVYPPDNAPPQTTPPVSWTTPPLTPQQQAEVDRALGTYLPPGLAKKLRRRKNEKLAREKRGQPSALDHILGIPGIQGGNLPKKATKSGEGIGWNIKYPRGRAGVDRSGISTGFIVIGDAILAREFKKLDAAYRRPGILGVGRRGALATRRLPSQPSRTNRRGAAATRAPQPISTPATPPIKAPPSTRTTTTPAAPPATAPRPATTTPPIQRPTTTAGPAPRIALPTQTRTTPRTRTAMDRALDALTRFSGRLGTRTRLAPGLRTAPGLATMPGTTTTTPRTPPRITPPRTTPPGTRAAPLIPSALTLSNPTLLGSTSAIGSQVATKGCECPKPKKEETKKREERCTNPIVSRRIDGDLKITTRKIVCQPSKSKRP
jgi:hypothetical protein